MSQKQLEQIQKWFYEYVAGFYTDDKYFNANIELKDRHSRAVCAEILYLADELGLDENQHRIAEVLGLLHDIGRFKQFRDYRTYNDPRSINHSLLGAEILKEHKVLDDLDPDERKCITQAVSYHGDKQLPDNLEGDTLLFSKMIRDADKIDIYRVVTEYYEQYLRDPDSFKLEVELPDEPWYSDAVVQHIMNEELIDYRELKTWNDCKLVQLSWIYDMNFPATFKRVHERGYLQKIIDFLPQTVDIGRVKNKILEYVKQQITKN